MRRSDLHIALNVRIPARLISAATQKWIPVLRQLTRSNRQLSDACDKPYYSSSTSLCYLTVLQYIHLRETSQFRGNSTALLMTPSF